MSFVEIMVFHLMADTKKIYIMEYHDTKNVVSDMVSANACQSASTCAAHHVQERNLSEHFFWGVNRQNKRPPEKYRRPSYNGFEFGSGIPDLHALL